MTIFLEITQHFLLLEIQKIIEFSIGRDISLIYGWGRNPELSKGKQVLLTALKQQIEIYKTHENDNVAYHQLKEKITTCLAKIADVRKTHQNQPEGKTEAKIVNLNTLVDEIYRKLSLLDVLDIQHDQNPLNIFRHYLALYFATKIVNDRNEDLIIQLIHDPHISAARSLGTKKEDLIFGIKEDGSQSVSKIQECKTKLTYIPKDVANPLQEKNEIVIKFMRDLQLENLQLYDDHGFDVGLPPRLPPQMQFFTPKTKLTDIQPGGGSLGECLRMATMEIKKSMMPVPDVSISTGEEMPVRSSNDDKRHSDVNKAVIEADEEDSGLTNMFG